MAVRRFQQLALYHIGLYCACLIAFFHSNLKNLLTEYLNIHLLFL